MVTRGLWAGGVYFREIDLVLGVVVFRLHGGCCCQPGGAS